MAQKAKKRSGKQDKQSSMDLLSHPATVAMIARIGHCNKPPILWRKQSDGSWLECYLLPDCTYGNCHAVDASEVPSALRSSS